MSISVLIPIYNAEKTLERSVRSVLEQTFPPQEIICCLNGCIDNSKQVLQMLARENGSIRILEQNLYKGIVPTLNRAIMALNDGCTLIARQDADDFWFPKKLELQLKFLEENKDVDILGTQMNLVKPGSYEVISQTNNPLDDATIKTSLYSSSNQIAHPSVLFKREVLLRTGGYDDSINLCEDFLLWLKASKWYKFANLSDILVNYTSTSNPNYSPVAPQLASHIQKLILQHFPK